MKTGVILKHWAQTTAQVWYESEIMDSTLPGQRGSYKWTVSFPLASANSITKTMTTIFPKHIYKV